jgi:hypothetical protein
VQRVDTEFNQRDRKCPLLDGSCNDGVQASCPISEDIVMLETCSLYVQVPFMCFYWLYVYHAGSEWHFLPLPNPISASPSCRLYKI